MLEHIMLLAFIGATVLFFGLYLHHRRMIGDHGHGAISFRTLAEVAPAGIWRTLPNGECIYVNKAWLEMTGQEDGDWQGHGWANALHPDDRERVSANWFEAISRKEIFHEELRWLRPDGTSLWVMCRGAPEYAPDGTLVAYVGINTDIQKSKQLEADLHTQRERAEAAAAAKASFLANMSHEIRTPMNGVIGFTELLLETKLSDEQHNHVQLIADSGRAMMQLLNDILDVSKIEAGQLTLVDEPTDIRQKLRHCVKLLEPMARSKGLALGVWVDDDVPDLVELDRLRTRQIILNLVGNAVKFTESGGIDVEARVENSFTGKQLVISVIDTGIGIDPAKLNSIFSPFTQEDGSVARRYGGTGLGLAISSQLVEMMGGAMSVQSKRDVGTNFTVRLPLKDVSVNALVPEPAAADQAVSMADLSGARILIAEDHSINQQLIMAMVSTLGIDAHLVENGAEAVRAVIEAKDCGRPFDAVLMDMQMPDVDGLEASRQIRDLGIKAETLPIIALTANCYPDDIAACRQAGMQSHLGKPVTTVALARELARCLVPKDIPTPLRRKTDFKRDKLPSSPSLKGLQERYASRKGKVVQDLRRSLKADPARIDWEQLASELHKLAGVAANFGEPEIGEASRRLEKRLKSTSEGVERMAALRREWPRFEEAA